jgi:uncharacterized protein (TIGR03000 family)
MRPVLLGVFVSLCALGWSPPRLFADPADTAPATVRVILPADAKLTFDGQATRSTSATRLFVTPPLESGKRYHYTLTAKYARDGQTITIERTVSVRAGRETVVSLVRPSRSGNGYWYGSETETPQGRYPPLYASFSDSRAPQEERGFQPHYWGTPPGDPFYPSDR